MAENKDIRHGVWDEMDEHFLKEYMGREGFDYSSEDDVLYVKYTSNFFGIALELDRINRVVDCVITRKPPKKRRVIKLKKWLSDKGIKAYYLKDFVKDINK